MINKAIIFDMDGTLIDSEKIFEQAWINAASDLNITLDKKAYQLVIGVPAHEEERVLTQHLGKDFPYQALRKHSRTYVEKLTHKGWPLKNGVKSMLEKLSNMDIPMAIATNARTEKAHIRLESTGIKKYFSHICGCDQVVNGKPAPDIYDLARNRLGLDRVNSLAIEDSNIGARAVQAAQLALVFIPDIRPPEDDVKQYASHISPSLSAAEPFLLSWLQS